MWVVQCYCILGVKLYWKLIAKIMGVVCEVVAGFLRLYWMLLIESNSVNSGTEVLRENVCTYEVTCFTNKLFSIKWRLHTENILTRILTFAKNVNWSLMKQSITNTTYITGTISYFIFIMFNAKIYTPICLFSFLLVTKCFFLRGSISQHSNELSHLADLQGPICYKDPQNKGINLIVY